MSALTEADVSTLKTQLKTWERAFKASQGRAPSKQDIKAHRDIAEKYSLYHEAKSQAAPRSTPTASTRIVDKRPVTTAYAHANSPSKLRTLVASHSPRKRATAPLGNPFLGGDGGRGSPNLFAGLSTASSTDKGKAKARLQHAETPRTKARRFLAEGGSPIKRTLASSDQTLQKSIEPNEAQTRGLQSFLTSRASTTNGTGREGSSSATSAEVSSSKSFNHSGPSEDSAPDDEHRQESSDNESEVLGPSPFKPKPGLFLSLGLESLSPTSDVSSNDQDLPRVASLASPSKSTKRPLSKPNTIFSQSSSGRLFKPSSTVLPSKSNLRGTATTQEDEDTFWSANPTDQLTTTTIPKKPPPQKPKKKPQTKKRKDRLDVTMNDSTSQQKKRTKTASIPSDQNDSNHDDDDDVDSDGSLFTVTILKDSNSKVTISLPIQDGRGLVNVKQDQEESTMAEELVEREFQSFQEPQHVTTTNTRPVDDVDVDDEVQISEDLVEILDIRASPNKSTRLRHHQRNDQVKHLIGDVDVCKPKGLEDLIEHDQQQQDERGELDEEESDDNWDDEMQGWKNVDDGLFMDDLSDVV